ncbi:unnamed protein product [Phytophthora fragariaefolia]|uniref:Unnamed protein product n=1 Tax=Phytophthora fragariaefolia TaxID=1490495 RepID=A0A9W7DB51_9STRA|nr:unnamed protein product [Phytophthora fragariaefolia]
MELKPPNNPPPARSLLFEDSEEEGEVQVDYEESPDEAPGSPGRSTSGTAAPPTRDVSPRVLRTPNPFPERPDGLLALRELSEPRDPPLRTVDSAMEVAVVTNDLDEAQSRQVALELRAPVSKRPVARPLLTPSVRDYGIQPRDPAETARHAASQPKYLCDRGLPWVGVRPGALVLTQRPSQLIAGKCEATDDAVASPRGAVDLSDQKRPRGQGSCRRGTSNSHAFSEWGSLSTLPDTGYAHGTEVSIEYVLRESGDSPVRRATPKAAVVLPQSPLPRSGAVAELSQSLRQLRLLVQDVDQRVYRCCDDIDSLHERLDWVQVPHELRDRIRGLDDQVAALERWVPHWQDSVCRGEETQRTLTVLRGQIDMLDRLREAPPGHYPVTAPMGLFAASSAFDCVGDALDPRSLKLTRAGSRYGLSKPT